jgi:hypothetical protein
MASSMRTREDRRAALVRRSFGDDHRRVSYFSWSLSLMGASAIADGIVGALLPPGWRLESLVALVAGAGAGVLVLGTGLVARVDPASSRSMERLFFTGSCVGTLTVGAVLLLLWRRSTPDAPAS